MDDEKAATMLMDYEKELKGRRKIKWRI